MTQLDAARYMTSLPKAERGAEYWRPAVTLISLIGEKAGCMFFLELAIRFGLRKGANPPPAFDPDRKAPPWRKGRLARDR